MKVKHIMNATNFPQNIRRVLVPMRKAIIDALLLTAFISWILVVTGVLFSFPWLVIVIYVLAYLLVVALRLRHAARQLVAARDQEEPLEEAYKELSSPRTLIGLLLFWGNRPF